MKLSPTHGGLEIESVEIFTSVFSDFTEDKSGLETSIKQYLVFGSQSWSTHLYAN